MSELPPGWTTTTVGEATLRPSVVDWGAWKTATFEYIDIGSIDNQAAQIANPKTLQISEAPSRARQVVQAGDTVYSTVRTYLRNIGYVDHCLDGQISSTGFCVLRPQIGINPRYIYYYTQSSAFTHDVSAQQRGVSYPAVTDSQVRGMPMPLAPHPEQDRIVASRSGSPGWMLAWRLWSGRGRT